jgi:hypothetical protein
MMFLRREAHRSVSAFMIEFIAISGVVADLLPGESERGVGRRPWIAALIASF